jgi:superfamily II DNA or RNA helicase
MTVLRPYQIEIIDKLVVATGQRRPICVAPTGAGKTIIAASLIQEAARKGSSVLVLAHRREIITQTVRKLYDLEVECGIIAAGLSAHPGEAVQVASIQTLWARAMRTDKMPLPPAHLLVVDEAHHCPAETYRKIVASYPNAVLLGLTATPCRGDGRGLGNIFNAIVECPQVRGLIDAGYLVPTRVYAPVRDDVAKGVETRKGDYVVAQLAERMDRDNLVGDIVTHWHKYGERRRTVCFAVNVRHSLHICNEFVRSGVRAEHIDALTPKAERDAALKRLESGETELISNCMVLTEGWDMPSVGCAILARPTRQMGLYRQMVGRVLRPAPGKTDCIVLDHSGAVYQHGLVEDEVTWTLDPDKRATAPAHATFRDALGYRQRLIACTKCGAIRIVGNRCNACGFLPAPPPRDVEIQDGELGLYRGGRTQRVNSNPQQWLAMLIHIQHQRHYDPGWVSHQFKAKFGEWPRGSRPTPTPPSPEVLSWVRSRQIAYAKARQKAGAA